MTATDTTIAARILTTVTAWEAEHRGDPDADLWNDLLYGLDGVDQDASPEDNTAIVCADGSRLEVQAGEWVAAAHLTAPIEMYAADGRTAAQMVAEFAETADRGERVSEIERHVAAVEEAIAEQARMDGGDIPEFPADAVGLIVRAVDDHMLAAE